MIYVKSLGMSVLYLIHDIDNQELKISHIFENDKGEKHVWAQDDYKIEDPATFTVDHMGELENNVFRFNAFWSSSLQNVLPDLNAYEKFNI